MAKTISQLHTSARQIKNATGKGVNTANVVGSHLDDVVDYLNEKVENASPTNLGELLTSLNTKNNPTSTNQILVYSSNGWTYQDKPSGGGGSSDDKMGLGLETVIGTTRSVIMEKLWTVMEYSRQSANGARGVLKVNTDSSSSSAWYYIIVTSVGYSDSYYIYKVCGLVTAKDTNTSSPYFEFPLTKALVHNGTYHEYLVYVTQTLGGPTISKIEDMFPIYSYDDFTKTLDIE